MTKTDPETPKGRRHPAGSVRSGPAAEQRVDAVERALSILDAFTTGDPSLSLSEIAERTGLYPSTILRLAASLARFGYLHREPQGRFRLGPTPLRLGILYREAFRMTDYVRPVLAKLVEITNETAAFYVREGDKRICLYRHHTPQLIRHHLEEGTELPLDRGASAHVLVAFGGEGGDLSVRRRGYAVSLGERDPQTAAIAAPVFGPGQRLAGSLGITGLLSRFQEADVDKLASVVVDHADQLSRVLGGYPQR